jgi:hypothetical protein
MADNKEQREVRSGDRWLIETFRGRFNHKKKSSNLYYPLNHLEGISLTSKQLRALARYLDEVEKGITKEIE